MKSKKLLSLLLAVMMMLSVVPFYASAAPIKLTRNNIEIVVPSVSPAEITYGQTLGELTLTGGEVWYVDGTGAKIQVSGYFTVYNATITPAANEAYEVLIKFVSTDENYTSSATYRSGNCTYTGTWPTIKVKAEAVATLAEAPVASSLAVGGKKIIFSVLSGGKVVDAQGNDITDQGKWQWPDTTIVVNESGTYQAVWKATNNDYDPITVDVYITVEAVQTKTYFTDENGNETVPEIVLPVDSTFSANILANYIEKLTANCGEFSASQVQTSNVDITALGEYECTARITPKNEYYSTEDLTFKLIVEPKVIEVTKVIYDASGKYIGVYTETERDPKGTYDVYVDDTLVGSGLKYGTYCVECPWEPEASGTYDVKVVYNSVENDKYKMEDYTTELEVNVARELTTEGLSNSLRVNGRLIYSTTTIVNGDEISLECTNDNFNGWEITDTEGNPVDVGEIKTQVMNTTEAGVTFEKVAGDLSCENIIFTMPDYDIIVKAKSTLDEEETPDDGGDDTTGDDTDTDDGNGGLDIDNIFGDLTEGDSDNAILNIFNNIIAWFKNIIETIKGFFRAIGDAT